jgi:hypothetical protein
MAPREVGADAAIAAGIAHGGPLDRDGALRLFYLAAATQASGRLVVAGDLREHALVFKRGVVAHASTTDPADDLGRFLVRRGVLTPEQLVRAEGAKAAAGGDLAAALIAQGLVPAADIAAVLQEHGAALVSRALTDDAAAWRWEPGVAPPPSSFPLGAPWAQLCAAVRGLDAAAVQARLGDREHRVAARAGGRIRLEDLRLTPQETRAAGLFDGVRTPSEIARAQPAEASTVLRLALLLAATELLSFGEARKAPPAPVKPAAPVAPPPAAKPAAPPAPPPPAGARPAAPPGSARPPAAPRAPVPPTAPRPAAAAPRPPPAATPAPARPPSALDPARLAELYARLKEADHFEVLGVKRDATAAQIKVAYFQLAKLYHPDAVPSGAAPETRKLCADVFSEISDAWSVLGEDAKRAEYLKALESGALGDVDALAILRAEEVFHGGTLLVKARRYDEALDKFAEAVGLNADEPEFGMWKAWCEFLLAQDKRAKLVASASAVETELRRNPKCVPGYLFLGQMHKVCGELDAAERYLKRGLAVAPDHPELLRELRYLRK